MKTDAIVEAARKDMSQAVDADTDNREEALDDLQQLAGRQWPEELRAQREKDGRPVITVNRLSQFVRQVTGDIRRLNPSIGVIPADNDATEETAEIIGGMLRQIQYQSGASAIYEAATESAAQCGMGAFRVLTEYEGPDSFNQEIILKRIANPFAVYWDPAAREPTREDARYCFITEHIESKEFARLYPDAKTVDVEHDGNTDALEHWHHEGSVVVAEYIYKEPVEKTIYLMPDGTVSEDKAMKDFAVTSRTVQTHKVMWAKVTGAEVLEGPREFPCYHIPVIAVMGEELHVGGEIVRTSVIRFAKDPQRLYNYWTSAQTELIALQPKAPYIVTADQVSGLEAFWNEANDSNRPYLPYNPDGAAPPPQRAQPPVPSTGMMQEIAKAVDDMKATTGIYDAGLGQRSNEQSGVAIRQRQLESDISTSIYTDNLEKAIQHCGRVLVDMIPKVYDTQRMVRILGEDDQEQTAMVNGQQFDPNQGVVQINPLTVGKYDVRVTVGPNYSTRRQETAEGMMQFVSAFPQAAQLAGDLIVKAMDWPDADKLAGRLKKALPPGILGPDEMEPEQLQAAQQQQAMQAQQMQQAQAMQAQAMQMEQAKAQVDLRLQSAKAEEAESDAMGARFDAMMKQLELAIARLQPPMVAPMGQMQLPR